ncbi:MAG: glucose-6-phosphate isomerase family protein [Candidatus Heimdallarchaeaceae archaeon]
MVFRDIIGLTIDSFDEELHFNRELIHTKGMFEYKVADLPFRKEATEEGKDKIVFKHYSDIYLNKEKALWDYVIFDVFLILPGFHAGEFHHIPGHYRNIADNGFHFPEIYQVVEGYGEFLLQQPSIKHEQVKDCILHRCQIRDIVVVPPSHGVTIINPSEKKTVIVRLRARDAEDITSPFTNTKGACYYREQDNKWDYNDAYEELPAMRLLPPPTKWKIIQRGIPIYRSYVENPWLAKSLIAPNPTEYVV